MLTWIGRSGMGLVVFGAKEYEEPGPECMRRGGGRIVLEVLLLSTSVGLGDGSSSSSSPPLLYSDPL